MNAKLRGVTHALLTGLLGCISLSGAAQNVGPVDATLSINPRVYELSSSERSAIERGHGVLLRAYEQARQFDASYQAALAEFESARLQATANLFAYVPSLRYSESVLEFERQNRKTTVLTMPLFSIDRIATFRSSDSRAAQALATLRLREYDLLTRLLTAASDFVQALESLRTNDARIATLRAEAEKARREFELGQGTLTDQRDTEVRLDQARATHLSLQAKRATAARALQTLTGSAPKESDYRLVRRFKSLTPLEISEIQQLARSSNAELMNANSALRLAELEHFRAKGALAPEVSYQISKSQTAVGNNDTQGLVISFPIQSNGLVNLWTTSYGIKRARAMLRQTEQQVEQNVERFHTLVTAGLAESNIRLQAIESAALSVLANEKSFRGGVRTRLDVLNSVQTQYQVNEDYVTTLLNLGQNAMNLGIQGAQSPGEIVIDLQRLLFQ